MFELSICSVKRLIVGAIIKMGLGRGILKQCQSLVWSTYGRIWYFG